SVCDAARGIWSCKARLPEGSTFALRAGIDPDTAIKEGEETRAGGSARLGLANPSTCARLAPQSSSCRTIVTLLAGDDEACCSVPSKCWRFSASSHMLLLSSSVEPVLTGHCGRDGERRDARRKGAVALQSPPLPSHRNFHPRIPGHFFGSLPGPTRFLLGSS